MAKWVIKKKVKYLVKDLHLLPLQRLGELLAINNNNNKKAKIFITFFPLTSSSRP